MKTHAQRFQQDHGGSDAKRTLPRKDTEISAFQYIDNRKEAVAQKDLQELANNSAQVKQLAQRQQLADDYCARRDLHNNRIEHPVAQRLKWSEVHTGKPTETLGISEKQMPEGVEEEEETKDRKVFAGETSKGRSGFMWYKEGTHEIQYDIKAMKQYRIIDPDVFFYTAVRRSALDPISRLGIDPNYGNVDKPKGSTQYNTRGFNYFGKDRKIPRTYGSRYLEPDPWTILEFKLPEGTLIERDPEIPNGLRTTYHIQPSDIQSGLT